MVVVAIVIVITAAFCFIRQIKNSAEYIDFNTQLTHNDWSLGHTGESITLEELNQILARVRFSKNGTLNKDIKKTLEILYNKHQNNVTTLSLQKISDATQLSARPLNLNRVRIAINFLVKCQVIKTRKNPLEATSYTFYLTKLHQFL